MQTPMNVRKSLAWMAVSQAALVMFQFASTIVIARLLSPFDMGIYAAANSIIGMLALIESFGVGSYVIREQVLTRAALTTAFTVNSLIVITIFVAILALSSLGSAFLHSDGVGHAMRVLALIPLIGLFEFLPATNLEREGNFKAIALVNLLRGAAGTTTGISLALNGFSYMSLAWGAVASSAVSAVGYMVIGRTHVSLRVGVTAFKSIASFGLQQLAIQGVNTLAARLSELFLGRLLGLSALGLYGRASNLNNLLWSNLHLVIGRVVLVDFAEKNRRGIDLRDSYLATVDVMTALLWPCFAGLAILAPPLIKLIYGEKWLPAAPVLAALSVSAILLVSITMTWELFVVCKQTARQTRIEVARTTVGTLLFLGGCFIGLTAAACARIGEALFSVIVYRPEVEAMTSTRLADYGPIYARSVLLTALACGPAAALMAVYHWSAQTPLGFVALAIASGGIAWLVALIIIKHSLVDEAMRIIRRVMTLFDQRRRPVVFDPNGSR